MGAMTGLLLLLWAGVTVGSVLDLQKRVIGGRDCSVSERQYHVILTSRNNKKENICGGSLISKQWILTAAHCWLRKGTMSAYVGVPPNVKGKEITRREIYKDDNGEHDIMLLQLPEDITDITPVKLPEDCTNNPLKIGDKVQIAGHSATAAHIFKNLYGKPVPLQCGDMTVVKCGTLDTCVKAKGAEPLTFRKEETLLCHEDDTVKTAVGDSGGGVVSNGRIYGVHTASPGKDCVGAAVSMNVCYGEFLDWIYEKTGIPKSRKRGASDEPGSSLNPKAPKKGS